MIFCEFSRGFNLVAVIRRDDFETSELVEMNVDLMERLFEINGSFNLAARSDF